MAKFQVNLSQRYFDDHFFDDLKANPAAGFMNIRKMVLTNEINGILAPRVEFDLIQAGRSNSLKLDINQRRGYKNVVFYT